MPSYVTYSQLIAIKQNLDSKPKMGCKGTPDERMIVLYHRDNNSRLLSNNLTKNDTPFLAI